MKGGDSGLNCEGASRAANGLRDKRQRLGDLLLVPSPPVLSFKKDHVTRFIEARIAPRIVQEHESQEARNFLWNVGRHQRSQKTSQTDRLRTEIGSH